MPSVEKKSGVALALLLIAIPLLALPALPAAIGPARNPVKASLFSEAPAIRPGESLTLEIVLDIEPGWHVYGASPGDTGLPTTVAWDLPPGFSARGLEWPKAERFSLLGVDSEGYSGKLVLRAEILAPRSIAIGASYAMKAKVEWLACRVECMPGIAQLALELPVTSASLAVGDSSRIGGFALALFLAFVGGLILNLMPCVLPVLSLKALAIAKRGLSSRGADRGGSLAQGLYFASGVIVSFWILAALLLFLRAGGQAIGWGFQLQSPGFVAAAAIAFFLIGLNLFGVFEVGLSLSRLGARGSSAVGGARGGAFLSGLFATAVATPCTAPFMGPAIGYALSEGPHAGGAADAAAALGVFTAMGLGMAAPLLLVSAVPGLARRLPKAGAWTVVFRQALGFPMMATVVWMAFVLSGLAGSGALIALIEGLLVASMGAWVWGSWGRLDKSGRARILAAVLAAALVAGAYAWTTRAFPPSTRVARSGGEGAGKAEGGALGSGATLGGTGSLRGGSGGGTASRADAFWRPWSEAALADFRSRGVPVFVDFTAAWCLSCQVNEAVALDGAAVRARFAELGVAALKADWTAKDEAIGRALAALGRASVPLYALYVPGKGEPVILPELLTQATILRYFEQSLGRKPQP